MTVMLFHRRVHLVLAVLLEKLGQLVPKETEVRMDHRVQEVKLAIAGHLVNLALKVDWETKGYKDVVESRELKVLR